MSSHRYIISSHILICVHIHIYIYIRPVPQRTFFFPFGVFTCTYRIQSVFHTIVYVVMQAKRVVPFWYQRRVSHPLDPSLNPPAAHVIVCTICPIVSLLRSPGRKPASSSRHPLPARSPRRVSELSARLRDREEEARENAMLLRDQESVLERKQAELARQVNLLHILIIITSVLGHIQHRTAPTLCVMSVRHQSLLATAPHINSTIHSVLFVYTQHTYTCLFLLQSALAESLEDELRREAERANRVIEERDYLMEALKMVVQVRVVWTCCHMSSFRVHMRLPESVFLLNT